MVLGKAKSLCPGIRVCPLRSINSEGYDDPSKSIDNDRHDVLAEQRRDLKVRQAVVHFVSCCPYSKLFPI